MNMAEDQETGFKTIASIKSRNWVFIFVAMQAILAGYLLKFNLQDQAITNPVSAYFLAAAPQALLMFAVSIFVLNKAGVRFSMTWADWATNYRKDLLLGALYFAGCLLLAYILSATGYPWGLPRDNAGTMIQDVIRRGTPVFLAYLFLTCALTPLAEELFFKRLLYVGVRQEMSARKSVILCALLFALVHSKATFLLVFTGNLLTYYMYERHKRLFANVVLHSLMNFFAVINKTF